MARYGVIAGVALVALLAASSLISAVSGIVGLIFRLAAWMLAGYLAGRLMRGRGYGPVGDIALGLLGGIVASIILPIIGLGGVGNIFLVGQILAGMIGAIVLIFLVRLFADEDFAK